MQIVFLNPPSLTKDERPVERVFGCTYSLYPIPNIFVLIQAAIARDLGFKVKYVDGAAMNWHERDLNNFLKKDKSSFIFIHSVNLSLRTDLKTLKIIRSMRKNVVTIFTGPAPTQFPQKFLTDQKTIVVRGEAEKIIQNLLLSYPDLEKVKGLSYLVNGQIRHNKPEQLINNLNSLPFPARDLVDNKLYYNPKINQFPWTVMLTSRGCFGQCIFCVPCSANFATELEYRKHHPNKPIVRFRSAKNIIKEFKLLSNLGFKSVSIVDDQFIQSEQHIKEISEGIKKLNINWGCLARTDRLGEKIVSYLKQAGCVYVDLGVESFDQKALNYLRKGIVASDIKNKVALLKKYGIAPKINILIGAVPWETEDTIMKTLHEVLKMKPASVMFSLACPFPGTRFYDLAKKNKWLKTYYPVDVQKKSLLNYKNLTSRQMENLIQKLNSRFFFSPKFLWQNLSLLKSPKKVWQALKSLKKKLS
ncbi:MAG: radical SAM protein [Patescibacteria group bacterium]|nr:radical SAM protein [Patescibacteria group bacterium]